MQTSFITSTGYDFRRALSAQKYQTGWNPEVLPMQPYEIMQHLSSIQVIDPSAQVIENIPAQKELHPLEPERLRGMIQTNHGDMSLLELSNEELYKYLELVRERDSVLYPTIA